MKEAFLSLEDRWNLQPGPPYVRQSICALICAQIPYVEVWGQSSHWNLQVRAYITLALNESSTRPAHFLPNQANSNTCGMSRGGETSEALTKIGLTDERQPIKDFTPAKAGVCRQPPETASGSQ